MLGMIILAGLTKIIIISILIGLIPASIAHSKGHNFFLWWIYGSAIFIIALPHSLMVHFK